MRHDEGYIKFTAEHSLGPAPDYPGLNELNLMRTTLHDMGLVGVLPDGVGFGNVSLRAEKGFIISGSGTGAKRVLDFSDYCRVNGFDLAKNSVKSEGPVNPSSESMSHGAIYLARKEVNCVLHVHSLRIFEYMERKGFPFTPEDAAFGTVKIAVALRERASEMKSEEKSIFMKGHIEGIIAFGLSADEAFQEILKLQRESE